MSYIYLIRHGRPELPDGRSYCIGRGSDLPLSQEGRRQSKALAQCFAGIELGRIYCSPLRRSRETAEAVSGGRWEISLLPGVDEISVGQWEGMSFDEIHTKYPDLYMARGKDWAIPPPGGESLESAAQRMENSLKEISGLTEISVRQEIGEGATRDVLVVTHDGAIRALLWRLMGLDTKKDAMIRQPYGSITVLKCENGVFMATAMGKLPEDSPSDEEIEELWDICDTPEDVRAHSYAVCNESLKIREKLKEAGLLLSHERLRAASLLHDMCRQDGNDHPNQAAKILRERGYLKVAHEVALHHSGGFKDDIDEAQVLFLADKLIDGTRTVTIQERFDASRKKCVTTEAMRLHNARYQEALLIQEKIDQKMRIPS